MQFKALFITLSIVISGTLSLKAQYHSQDSTYQKYFVGSTFFMLGNLLPANRPDFVQLNLGYRLTRRDVVSLELKTWKYGWPLGIPYGSSYEAPEEEFPGHIREFGFALAYQHYWYKGLYNAIHVMNAWQTFTDENGEKIENGFQIFNTYRLGYHCKLFKDRFFIEPSLAVTHRPYHTEMPDGFRQIDARWAKFFFGEPGLHFGYNF